MIVSGVRCFYPTLYSSNRQLSEKCLGKGRSSSRIASQKITSSAIESALLRRDSVDGVDVPDLADHDWKDKKKKRTSKKKDKQQSKRPKFSVSCFSDISKTSFIFLKLKNFIQLNLHDFLMFQKWDYFFGFFELFFFRQIFENQSKIQKKIVYLDLSQGH